MSADIVVLGSSNTDMIVKLQRLPKPGETVIGGQFSMAAGGKGANQAVAAARAGGRVTFITRIGNDSFGHQTLENLKKEGVETSYVGTDPGAASGIALIFVDEHGENSIGVSSGANAEIRPADVANARQALVSSKVLLAQLEIPLAAVESAMSIASGAGVRVILNPAPACLLPGHLYKMISVLTPNENEAEVLTGIRVADNASVAEAASRLLSNGAGAVVITLGARGCYIADCKSGEFIAPFKVAAIDTTAAGDVFNGALSVALAEDAGLRDAAVFASAAAAISVTRLGAQPSAPLRREILDYLQRNK